MKVCRTINLRDDNFNVITLHPGDTVPEWAESKVTNEKVILVEDPTTEPAVDHAAVPAQVLDYADMKRPELRKLAASRGVDSNGRNDEIRAALMAQDAENAAADSGDEPEDGEGDGDDLWSMNEAELRQLAADRGVDHEGASTSAELVALLSQAGE